MISRTYVNGVIAAKEQYFLKDKLLRCCETDAVTALRILKESGFGGAGNGENCSVEDLIAAEEREINRFIREYAANEAEREYFLAPSDTHNVKAFFKANALLADVTPMLAAEGTLPIERVAACFEKGDFSALPAYLAEAVYEAQTICADGTEEKGAAVGAAFERRLYEHLSKACRYHGALRRLLSKKADLTNFVVALRSATIEEAESGYVTGGKTPTSAFAFIFEADEDKSRASAQKSGAEEYYLTYEKCRAAGNCSIAEKAAQEAEIDYFEEKKCELSGKESFLYYVLRKKTQCFNVRLIAVCLNAGLKESEIKKRLRGVR